VLGVLGKCWSERWQCWLLKAVVDTTADGLRTVAGTRATHHHGVTFAGTGATGRRWASGCRWPWVRAVPRPGRVGPGTWPRTTVGAARRGTALSGARIAHSSQPHAAVSHAAVDLVVLSDYLVADPRMVRDLHSQGVPHLPVRVRDGTGLVGPLVIPGVTSWLGKH
jgi:hypothetical protein